MPAVYALDHVQKTYAGRRVLDLDSLTVQPGEFWAIIGPSGAGKSTLLRLLNFLEYPDQGEICYAGQPVNPALPLVLRRQVTTVFQRPVLLNASVEANVACGLRLRGQRDSQLLISETMEKLGLASLRRAPARTLSGGEMQRVALARALVIRPQVLLLDEPTANLDPYNVGLIETVVGEINQQQGTTVILVTHNVFQARRLAQRAALLLNGQIIEANDVHSFYENPRDPRTRAFVNGDMIC